MDICFQVVLFQTEKSFSRAHYYYYYYIFFVFIRHVEFQFFLTFFLFFFSIFFFFFLFDFFFFVFAFVCWQCWSMSFFNFALNVVFFSVYIICNIEGAASFSSVAVYSLRSLPCVCVCVSTFVCMWLRLVNEYVCAPLCLGTPTLLRCRGVQDQQIVKEWNLTWDDYLVIEKVTLKKSIAPIFVLKLKNVELCSAKDCSRSWD